MLAFCERHPEFEPEAFSLPGADAPTGMLTCFPHLMKGEGQFVARLRKKGSGSCAITGDTSLPRPDKQQLAALRSFCPSSPVPTAVLGETLISLPDCPDLKGLKVLRAGLHLGSLRGKVFLPDHAWAVSADPPPFPRVELTE